MSQLSTLRMSCRRRGPHFYTYMRSNAIVLIAAIHLADGFSLQRHSLLFASSRYYHDSPTARLPICRSIFDSPTVVRSAVEDSNKEENDQTSTSSAAKRMRTWGKQLWNWADFLLWDVLATGLIKGVTLPFPVLRRMIPSSSSSERRKETRRSSRFLTIGLTFREGLVALLLYLLSGVLAYSVLLEHWSIVDALYFTCVCFSTVGYGDLCPTNAASRIFTCCFGMGGIAFLGAAVAAIGGHISEAESNLVQSAGKQSRRRIMRLFEGMPTIVSAFRDQSQEKQRQELLDRAKQARAEFKEKIQEDPLFRVSPLESSPARLVRRVITKISSYLLLLLAGGLIMNRLNGNTWSVSESLYYSLATGASSL